MVERLFPPRLAPKGCLPKVMQKNRILKVVDRVHNHKTPDITCILTDFVDGEREQSETEVTASIQKKRSKHKKPKRKKDEKGSI